MGYKDKFIIAFLIWGCLKKQLWCFWWWSKDNSNNVCVTATQLCFVLQVNKAWCQRALPVSVVSLRPGWICAQWSEWQPTLLLQGLHHDGHNVPFDACWRWSGSLLVTVVLFNKSNWVLLFLGKRQVQLKQKAGLLGESSSLWIIFIWGRPPPLSGYIKCIWWCKNTKRKIIFLDDAQSNNWGPESRLQ